MYNLYIFFFLVCTKKIARKQVATMLKHREAPRKVGYCFSRGGTRKRRVTLVRLHHCPAFFLGSFFLSLPSFLRFCFALLAYGCYPCSQAPALPNGKCTCSGNGSGSCRRGNKDEGRSGSGSGRNEESLSLSTTMTTTTTTRRL